MIDINLIPVALRKSGKENASLAINIPQEIILGVGVGLIFVMLTVHLLLGAVWFVGLGRLPGYRASWQKVMPDRAGLESMKAETRILRKRIKLISGITTKEIVLWAPKFNAISDDLPRGLWLKKMTLEKGALTMEGSVVSKSQNEINNVGLFLATLKKNNDFMKDISSLEVNSIERGRNNTVEVTDFTVMAKLIEIITPSSNETRHK